VNDDQLAAAGLFDPATESPRRGELLRRCLALGMTVDEIREAGDDLLEWALDLVYTGGREQLTFHEAAARAGLPAEQTRRIASATGIGAELDARVWDDDDVRSMATFAEWVELFGEDALMQILRVSASAVARIGDAARSTFLTSVAAPAMARDESGLELLEANEASLAMLPELSGWLHRALRRDLRLNFRDMSDEQAAVALDEGIDTRAMAIGFADLIGSTSHAEQRTLVELNAALNRFESAAVEAVTTRGGRVVKFMGDEVMFRADRPEIACMIAIDLSELVRADPELPPLRAGVAYGEVLSREGDCYGPTVNLAARIVKLAPMNGVVATLDTARALGSETAIVADSLGAIEMPGFSHPVELAALRRSQ
jgi:class 3 adenylate cyclase